MRSFSWKIFDFTCFIPIFSPPFLSLFSFIQGQMQHSAALAALQAVYLVFVLSGIPRLKI